MKVDNVNVSLLALFVFQVLLSESVKTKNVTTKSFTVKNGTTNKLSKPQQSQVDGPPVPVTLPPSSRARSHLAKKFKGGKHETPTAGPVNSSPKPGGSNMITPAIIQDWAAKISDELFNHNNHVVREAVLLKGFSDIKVNIRDGSTIVEKSAEKLEELLNRRAKAAERISNKAEELARDDFDVPSSYQFDSSQGLDQLKMVLPSPEPNEIISNCSSQDKIKLQTSAHFNGNVSLESTSVYVTAEVFPCDSRVIPTLYWSEGLLPTFRDNHADDATTSYQYFCSAKGFLRHFPAAPWEAMFKFQLGPKDEEGSDESDETPDIYDCRLRPWYVAAGGAPRDVLILVDASGSMYNSSNKVIAEKFSMALLNALTDDDQVNLLRFNVEMESPIECFNDKLVSANHVNTVAMMAAMQQYLLKNETLMKDILQEAVQLLQSQKHITERPQSCQQAIVLLTDQLYANYSEWLGYLDPEGRIRLFVLWLHDINGLRDDTKVLGEAVSCARDGSFAELITHADVNEQVLKILQVLERPLVHQRKEKLRVFSDVYAHVEDPRRAEYYWQKKENQEQRFRYMELRKHKDRIRNESYALKYHMDQVNFDRFGYYYEGVDQNYRLQISVSVPIFDSTLTENITVTLFEYPVNRLLGVAGVDIPLDDLKLIFPFHELGAGGSLFVVDHRGSIIFHENLKPLLDGDILKPGYRTVDFLDIEQPAADHLPRDYPHEWLEFRKALIIEQKKGKKTTCAKQIFEGGMRALLELREYHWRRVLNHYTVVVSLPSYGRHQVQFDPTFTQQLAEEAYQALHGPDFSVHPDWLYCRHVDPYFSERNKEILHFIMRRRDEANFAMNNLKHFFSPLPPGLLEKTYQCDEKLMARLCKEAIATEQWAVEHEDPKIGRDCSNCILGSTTAFFATESGLTRWQQYHATVSDAVPPEGNEWPLGPMEPFYKRAAAHPNTMIVHAPVVPVRRMRNTFKLPPPLGVRHKWLTAAKTVSQPPEGGPAIVGVAGFHFHPKHLERLLVHTVNFPCAEDDPRNCRPSCKGDEWTCVLIDEGGWLVSYEHQNDDDEDDPYRVRGHLVNLHPGAMAALLQAKVFKLHWLHDYQAVCFPPEDEVISAASSLMPSLLKSLWRTVYLVVYATRQLVTVLSVITLGGQVQSETFAEKEKRRKRLKKDYERELYERLFDEKVLINRTRVAACDRSRPMYEFQRTPDALEALRRPRDECAWPLVGALVPKTNLILLAIWNACTHKGRPVPDPLANEQIHMTEEFESYKHSASRLACWRNKVVLPSRPPDTTCFPHNYADEEGYRQCGPWLPDPEPKKGSGVIQINNVLIIVVIATRMSCLENVL